MGQIIIRSDEELTLETSAIEYLYIGQFTLSTQLIKPIYLVILPTDAAPQFLQKLTPLAELKDTYERSSSKQKHIKVNQTYLLREKYHQQTSTLSFSLYTLIFITITRLSLLRKGSLWEILNRPRAAFFPLPRPTAISHNFWKKQKKKDTNSPTSFYLPDYRASFYPKFSGKP